MPVIYLITPTNGRVWTQLAELIRFRNTIVNVPNLLWIVIEDAKYKTRKISNFLSNSRILHVHLNELTPDDQLLHPNKHSLPKPRGVFQRNKGLAWLRDNQHRIDTNGVIYFADDDNTYDAKLFEEVITLESETLMIV